MDKTELESIPAWPGICRRCAKFTGHVFRARARSIIAAIRECDFSSKPGLGVRESRLVNMAESFVEFLDEDPSNIHTKDDRGWTFLHQQALAGTTAGVSILLERGADPNAVTDHGMTPLQLAKSLGWNRVADVVTGHGAT